MVQPVKLPSVRPGMTARGISVHASRHRNHLGLSRTFLFAMVSPEPIVLYLRSCSQLN